VLDGDVVAELPLPLAGLMSDRGAIEVSDRLQSLRATAARALGVTVEEPFMQLSFIALSVIPQLRITDGGTLDVGGQRYVTPQIS
jgi:adenine deaminase